MSTPTEREGSRGFMFGRRGRLFLKVGAVALFCSLAMPAGAAVAKPILPDDERQETPAATHSPPETSPGENDPVVHQGDGEARSTQSDLDRARLLDGEELANLAARAEKPTEDLVGGALTNQQLTYIVIALAAAVIVLIVK